MWIQKSGCLSEMTHPPVQPLKVRQAKGPETAKPIPRVTQMPAIRHVPPSAHHDDDSTKYMRRRVQRSSGGISLEAKCLPLRCSAHVCRHRLLRSLVISFDSLFLALFDIPPTYTAATKTQLNQEGYQSACTSYPHECKHLDAYGCSNVYLCDGILKHVLHNHYKIISMKYDHEDVEQQRTKHNSSDNRSSNYTYSVDCCENNNQECCPSTEDRKQDDKDHDEGETCSGEEKSEHVQRGRLDDIHDVGKIRR